ncbi:4426_t:CDS:2 [Paraglomus occultum]|uniref:4426_t:CDS:1 n=1 Tax=Paraglomus occultum TaxID=144539 RepID=A0A9N9C8C0_9GLOM|nr:4426_t:CDS:2 [Paraglomus occultum]
MGNDGGSIPKRIELVKEKKKEVRPDQTALKIAIWFFCALSKSLLQDPVVICALGKLYNKDAVLEFLLNKEAYGDGDMICSHITSIKDVKTLKLTPNPAYKETSVSTLAQSHQGMVARFVCPISMKEMNGKSKFVYLDTCGCVFSEQGLKQVPAGVCVKKGKLKELNGENSTALSDNVGIKRKLEDDTPASSQITKKLAIEQSSSNVNISSTSAAAAVNQRVKEHLVNNNKKKSEAIRSIYKEKKDKDVTESYLVRGTFNRYAA